MDHGVHIVTAVVYDDMTVISEHLQSGDRALHIALYIDLGRRLNDHHIPGVDDADLRKVVVVLHARRSDDAQGRVQSGYRIDPDIACANHYCDYGDYADEDPALPFHVRA